MLGFQLDQSEMQLETLGSERPLRYSAYNAPDINMHFIKPGVVVYSAHRVVSITNSHHLYKSTTNLSLLSVFLAGVCLNECSRWAVIYQLNSLN